jgi:hypothetical protein
MGFGDFITTYLQDRAFVKGGEFTGLAQGMEQFGHFGPAVRMYDEAMGKYIGSATDHSILQTRHARDCCAQKALQNGEDSKIAFGYSLSDILKDPRRYVEWYYSRQGTTVPQFCQENLHKGKFQEVADWTVAAQRWARSSEVDPVVLAYNCFYFGGVACFRLGDFTAARQRLEQAYSLSRSHPEIVGIEPRTWDAYFLGCALARTGDDAGGCLAEALSGFSELRANGGTTEQNVEDAARALAQYYSARLSSGDREKMVAAAKEIGKLSAQPGAGFAHPRVASLGTEARACLEIEDKYNGLQRHWRQKEYAEATALCLQLIQNCDAPTFQTYKKLAEEAYAQIVIQDPSRLPEHAGTIQRWIESGSFAEADKLHDRLSAFHKNTPELKEMGQRIRTGKRANVDRRLLEVQGLLTQQQIERAETLLEEVAKLARGADYSPPTLTEGFVQLARAKAERLTRQAQEDLNAGNCGRAVNLLETALELPNLDTETRAGLQESLKDACRYRDSLAGDIQARLAELIAGSQLEAARDLLADAKAKGTDLAAGAERDLIELHFETLAEAGRARALLARGDLAGPAEVLARAAAKLDGRNLPTATALLDTVRSELEALWIKAEANYCVPPQVASLLTALLWGLVHWLALKKGFFGAVMTGTFLGLTVYGIECIYRRKSILAHNGMVHGLTLAGASAVAFLAYWFTPWIVYFGLGAGAYVGIDRYLRRQCPCVKPRTQAPSQTEDSGKAIG